MQKTRYGSLWDDWTRQVSIKLINGYQKHISPHKGFHCAHRLLHGGESCSEYVKRIISQEGLQVGWKRCRRRFQACQQANMVLRSPIENSEPADEEKATDGQPPAPVEPIDASCCVDGSCALAELALNPDCTAVGCGSCS